VSEQWRYGGGREDESGPNGRALTLGKVASPGYKFPNMAKFGRVLGVIRRVPSVPTRRTGCPACLHPLPTPLPTFQTACEFDFFKNQFPNIAL
jgi:hypothetical protein